jgi:RHS repeat-associated protein
LIAVRKGTTLSYILQDHLGSTSVTADSSGAAASTIAYLPFGSTRSSTSTQPTDRLFTSQILDTTGLYYYGARYYDPGIGRFISPDTVVQDFTNPQTLNRYSYCLNNPLKYTDPSGHIIPVLAIIGIALIVSNVAACAYDSYQMRINPSNENALYCFADIVDPNPVPTRIWTTWVKQAGKGLAKGSSGYKKAGVWLLDNFARGNAIEKRLGGMCNNFPTIDKYVKGADGFAQSVTSIKSIDVTADTYNQGNNLRNKIQGYVDELIKFPGDDYGPYSVWVNSDTQKILELALPPAELTQTQKAQLEAAYSYANDYNIQITLQYIE